MICKHKHGEYCLHRVWQSISFYGHGREPWLKADNRVKISIINHCEAPSQRCRIIAKHTWATYRRFGCTEVHRERNTVEDPFWHIGPVSYRRMNSSLSAPKMNKNQPPVKESVQSWCYFEQADLKPNTIKTWEVCRRAKMVSRYFSRWRRWSAAPFFCLSKNAQQSVDSPARWRIFLHSPTANITDAPPRHCCRGCCSSCCRCCGASFHLAACISAGLSLRGEGSHPCAGQVQGIKGGGWESARGESPRVAARSRWVSLRCVAADARQRLLLSTPLPSEEPAS